MRLLLGYALVGVSLFMLLGFFNADVGSGVARALAFLIGVGIPGAAGAVLLTQHYGGKKRLAGSREELKAGGREHPSFAGGARDLRGGSDRSRTTCLFLPGRQAAR